MSDPVGSATQPITRAMIYAEMEKSFNALLQTKFMRGVLVVQMTLAGGVFGAVVVNHIDKFAQTNFNISPEVKSSYLYKGALLAVGSLPVIGLNVLLLNQKIFPTFSGGTSTLIAISTLAIAGSALFALSKFVGSGMTNAGIGQQRPQRRG